MPVIEVRGFEADDVIATLSRQAVERGLDVVVVSADKDLLQLVADRVRVVNPGREGSGSTSYDRRAVEEKWGVPPERIVDVLALVGDAVDNIPGVAGIGDKGARDLVREFGPLEAVLDNADKVKRAAYREGLKAHRAEALLSKQLVTLREDVPVELDLGALRLAGPDPAAAHALFKELEFQVLAREYAPEIAPLAAEQRLAVSRAEIDAVVAEARAASRVAIGVGGDEHAGDAGPPARPRAVVGARPLGLRAARPRAARPAAGALAGRDHDGPRPAARGRRGAEGLGPRQARPRRARAPRRPRREPLLRHAARRVPARPRAPDLRARGCRDGAPRRAACAGDRGDRGARRRGASHLPLGRGRGRAGAAARAADERAPGERRPARDLRVDGDAARRRARRHGAGRGQGRHGSARPHEPRDGGTAPVTDDRDPPPRQGRVQHQLAGAAARGAVRAPQPEERQEDGQDARGLHGRGRARGAGARPRAAAEDPRLPLRAEAQVDLRRRAAGARPPRDRPHPRHLQPGGGGHRAALRHRPQPAEHPDPHARGPPHPRGLRRRARPPAALRRLQPDRAQGAGAPLERPDTRRHVPPRRGRARPHLARDLRPALAGAPGPAAPHLQDGQLRSALREDRLHARQGPGRLARGGGPVHRGLLRALSAGARLHRPDDRRGARERPGAHAARAAAAPARPALEERPGADGSRAPGHEHAGAGLRGGPDQARDDRPPPRARRAQACARGSSCRSTTSCCSRCRKPRPRRRSAW